MPINKVMFNGSLLIDLTNDDVTPEDVRSGISFHNRSGMQMLGSMASQITKKKHNPNNTIKMREAK